MPNGNDYERGRRDALIEARFVALEQTDEQSDAIQRGLRRDLEEVRTMVDKLAEAEMVRAEVDKSLQQSAKNLQVEAASAREFAELTERRSLDRRTFIVGLFTVIAIWAAMFISLYAVVAH